MMPSLARYDHSPPDEAGVALRSGRSANGSHAAESRRRLRVPVRDYLNEILPGLANKSIQEVADITPDRWAARHSR
jgi:hypothetical protein